MSIKATNTASKYGVADRKKAELDSLTEQVFEAQYQVQLLQANETSLTEKLAKFDEYLVYAEANQSKALSNKNELESIVQNSLDLESNSKIAWNETVLAKAKLDVVAGEMQEVMNKLIYSTEVINKLSNLIVRKKAMNPLIPDELIELLSKAGKEANNSVALTLVALKSSFIAETSITEANSAATLEYHQAANLYQTITHETVDEVKSKETDQKTSNAILSLKFLIYEAYSNAQETSENLRKAVIEITNQKEQAKTGLSEAEVRLESLEAGLAAANAAALSS